jgi:hypothetical protein
MKSNSKNKKTNGVSVVWISKTTVSEVVLICHKTVRCRAVESETKSEGIFRWSRSR